MKLTNEQLKEKYKWAKNYMSPDSNAADASTRDPNANVTMKNILTMSVESHKADDIQFNRFVISHILKDMYSQEIADKYINQLESHEIYCHDESHPYLPYSYYQHTPIYVRINGKEQYLTIGKLFARYGKFSTFDNVRNMWVTKTEDIKRDVMLHKTFIKQHINKRAEKRIYDGQDTLDVYETDKVEVWDNNKFVQVTHLIKHPQEEDKAFVVYQTNNGDFAFVTEDHPVILEDGSEIKANILKIGDAIKDAVKDVPEVCENVHVDTKLAYFLGFLLGDGNMIAHELHEDYIDSPVGCVRFTRGGNLITLYQNDIETSKILKVTKDIFPKANIFKFDNDAEKKDRCRSFSNWNLSALVSFYFGYGYRENSFTKHLPTNFMQWETESKLAFVAGLLDSDGTVSKTSGRCSIRLKSYATINVLYDALKTIGLSGVYKRLVGTNVKDIMFAVDFRGDERLLKYSEKLEKINPTFLQNYNANLDTTVRDNKIKKIITFSKKDVNQNSFLYNEIAMVYDITTETGTFTANGMVQHNCVAIDSSPFMFEGLKNLGCETTAPKHLSSYAGGYYNLISMIASQFAGAVADVGMLKDFYYFAKKDYGEDFLNTHKDIVEDRLSQIIYSLNTPAGTRGFQAIFYNTSVFDEYYFKGLYGASNYPDGSKVVDSWKGINELQKFFLTWFNTEREKALLTFPVITAALKLNDDSSIASDEWRDYVAKEFSEGNSFFVYMDKNVTSLSSCCFRGDQKTISKSSDGVNFMTFEELDNATYKETKRNFTIFHNGSWVKGKPIKVNYTDKFNKITTANNKEMVVTKDHEFPTLRGDVKSENLTTEDYLLTSTLSLATFPEQDKKLTYEEGFLLGMFLGDGSFDYYKGEKVALNLSLNKQKYENTYNIIVEALNRLGVEEKCVALHKIQNNTYPVYIYSKEVTRFICEYTEGTKSHTKILNPSVLLQDVAFREGILAGWYATDGGNTNRCYTVSEKLAESMELLLTSLGKASVISVTDRTNEPVIIRGRAFKRNYPLFCVRWYDAKNKRTMGDVYKIKNNSLYFKIRAIEEVNNDTGVAYCFEMANEDEPYFTLPNGIITHNCRLRNDIGEQLDNTFMYTLSNTGISTGSQNVLTINMNRLIQDGVDLSEQLELIYKYQSAFTEWFHYLKDAGMMPVYDASYIALEKQYLTIGVNGIVEAAEYLGMQATYNPTYIAWLQKILGAMKEQNKKAAKHYTEKLGYKVMFNTEFVPAENTSSKFYQWDKRDGYVVPEENIRNLYNSYFYPVEDKTISVIDKIRMHGAETIHYLDGGSALHLNFEEHLTKEGWKKLLDVTAKAGTNYWTYNVRSTICNKCGYIGKRDLPHCIKCGSEDVDKATRVIGYLRRETNFSKPRRIEASRRFKHGDK